MITLPKGISSFVFLSLVLTVIPWPGGKGKLVAVVNVIAYDTSVTQLAQLTSVPSVQVLVVRVGKVLKGQESSRYIKIVYRYGPDEVPLPKEIFNANNNWRLILRRDHTCESSLGELQFMKGKTEDGKEVILQRLRRTMGAEKEALPDELILPCYVLRPGDLRAVE